MAQRKTLTERQVSVLRWIGDTCPSGVMDGDAHRISAAALRNRGVLTTSGRGDTWLAEITEAGHEYLGRVDGPEPPAPRQENISVTQKLVDDVIAGGGSVRVPRKNSYDTGGVDYEKRVRLAERHAKVPPGKRLTTRVVSQDELEVELLDAPAYIVSRAELVPVVVPARVGRLHPAAREFRQRTERHEVSRTHLPRATRILQAIALESERQLPRAPRDPGPPRLLGRAPTNAPWSSFAKATASSGCWPCYWRASGGGPSKRGSGSASPQAAGGRDGARVTEELREASAKNRAFVRKCDRVSSSGSK